jgi:hypothetical protein
VGKRGAIVLLACIAALVSASAAHADVLGVAGTGLAKDPLYVEPGISPAMFGNADAKRVRSAMRDSGAGQVYVAVLAAQPGLQPPVTAEELARGVAGFVREDGTYAVFFGEEFAAVSTELDRGVAQRLAARSIAESGNEGMAATLSDFLLRLGPMVREKESFGGGDFAPRPSDEGDGGGSPVPVIAAISAALGIAGGAGYLLGRRRRPA